MHPMIDRRSFLLLPLAAQAAPKSEIWKFDRLDRLGKHPTQIVGNPKLILTPKGKAIEFDGDDALFLDVHPLAGATAFTWEVIFKPYSGGGPEQRFFHLTENGSNHRYLFETRIIGKQWCLDTFGASSTGQQALMDRSLLHPLDEWHHAAFVYDGSEMRHYVNHKLELKANVKLAPQGEGKCSIGVRYNKVDYFKGAIRYAAFHRTALPVSRFNSW
jgi:hypothetical protein